MHKVMSDTEVKTYIKDLRRKKFNKRTEFADWLISPFISDNPNQSIREVAIRVACVVRADINDVITAISHMHENKQFTIVDRDLMTYKRKYWKPGNDEPNFDKFIKLNELKDDELFKPVKYQYKKKKKVCKESNQKL